MLQYLEQFASFFGPLRLFGYTSSRCLGALLTAFVLMLVVMPPLIRWLKRQRFGEQGGKGQGAAVVDNMRQAKAGTPTMGGLGIVFCIVVTSLLWCVPTEPKVWLCLVALLAFAFLGFIDDRTKIWRGSKGMPGKWKLLLQILFGLGLGAWFLQIDHIKQVLEITQSAGKDVPTYKEFVGGYVVLPFLKNAWYFVGWGMILWILLLSFCCSNGVNFTDGLDGLAGGTMFIATIAFTVIAFVASNFKYAHFLSIPYVPGGEEIAVLAAAIAGACLGFLWFNSHPAEVFMGDTGSQALGGVLTMVAACTKQEFLIPVVGFVFMVEALSVGLQVASFKMTGKRIFLCAPIHHHFQYKGWPETKIVLRFWLVAALAALLALSTLKLR